MLCENRVRGAARAVSRLRIAVFSPVRPVPSGISDYCEELLLRLAGELEIDLYLDGYEPKSSELARSVDCLPAERFVSAHGRAPYDLVVYHLGNARCHDYIYPHLYATPGLAVLHDLSLHSTRLDTALESWTGEQYRAEMIAAYGDRGATAAELALAGLHNRYLLRFFPAFELPVRASAMTAVHEEWVAERVREAVPSAQVRSVPMGIERREVPAKIAAEVRTRLGIDGGAFVVGTFGMLTPEKRIHRLLRAFKWLLRGRPDARCLLVGAAVEALDLDEMIRELELQGRVVATGRLPMDDFIAHMAACDAVAFLRWPTQRETSAAMLRVMSLGRAVVVSDLAHLRDLPDSATVRIPLVGEEQALRRALLELAENRPMRERIGAAAARHVAECHGWDQVGHRWLELIGEAAELAAAGGIDTSFLPLHLRKK